MKRPLFLAALALAAMPAVAPGHEPGHAAKVD